MARNRRTREEINSDNQLSEEEKSRVKAVDRIREESIARFTERQARNGNMDSFNSKLQIDLDVFKDLFPGFYPRWFNDKGARLAQFRNKGWDFVPPDPRICVGDPVPGGGNTDLGNRISVIAGADSTKDEGAFRMVLMMIPEENWKKRKKQKQEANDEIDRAVNAHLEGKGEGSTVENSYKPGQLRA